MAERKRTRTVYRLAPCPLYDVERMESWLGDMARQGLFLQEEGIAWGTVRFQRGEPREIEYRLVSRRKPQAFWKRMVFGDPDRFLGPQEDELDLFAQFGWKYVSQCGHFSVYQAVGDSVIEVDSEPEVQAISIQAVRDVEANSVLFLVFSLVLNYQLYLRGDLFYMMSQGYLRYLLGLYLLPLWVALLFFIRVLFLERLRRKLKRGEPPDHHKPWRKGRALHFGKRGLTLLILALAVGMTAWGNWLNHSWEPNWPGETRYTIAEYPQDPPFPTVADLAPPGDYRQSYAHFSSGVTERTSPLVPVTICWYEKANVTLEDGSVYTGALCLEYHQAAAPWIARGMASDYAQQDRTLSRQFHTPYDTLTLPDLDADYAFGYVDPWNNPALVIQKGNKMIHASLEQTGDHQLSLEEWTIQMSEAIQ